MRLWCPKMLLTVLVMKLRAFSRSCPVRVSAGGSWASGSATASAGNPKGDESDEGCTDSANREVAPLPTVANADERAEVETGAGALGGVACLATASMQLRDSSSDSGVSMLPAGTKAARSVPLRRPSTSTSTRRAMALSPSERACISCLPSEVLAKTVSSGEMDHSSMAESGVCSGVKRKVYVTYGFLFLI